MAKKILGVENLDVIRDFVLSKVMTESDEIKRTLTEENAEYLQSKILEATNSLKSDYESKYDSLTAQIEKLKLEGADADAIRELELQLDALNNNYVDMQNSLNSIENSIIDIESSVMSPGQLNELLDAALIEKTTITDDMVETPNVYTKNLVALIAKFGTVRALNIVGDEIEGKTISAYDKIEGTNEPTWKLDRQGDGYLANKNISWDKNGNVTFGPDVKIGWGSVTDTPDDFGSGISIFTSTVFKRSNEKPSKPTGGSYSKPYPTDTTWTDGIPTGEEKLWACTRVFASDGGSKQQTSWSEPAQMTDTATFDVEFSSVAKNPGNPTDNPTNWSNDGTADTIWMATRTISNGVTSDWTITKIKGEDGKDGKDGVDGKNGKDGTSISVAGTFATEAELIAAYPNGPDPVTNAYVVGTDLYVWASGSWKNVGQFTGKDGKDGKDGTDGQDGQDGAQVYLHIKYADSIAYDNSGKNVISVDWTDDNGEVKGPYQGMYSDYVEADSTDCKKYKWFQIDAEKAVQTEFGKYKITSNTISGKTLQTTTKLPLVVNTQFEIFDENGLSKGTTTSDGSTEGPAWQLRNMGQGYLAQGNIRWDANGNVVFGPKVKLGWSNIDGPTEQYKLTSNIPYLRRKDSGKLDYNNDKNDPLLSIINDKGTGDKMFTITVKEYNSTTGEYDKSITDTIKLYRLLTYTDGTTHKPGYANAPNGVYSGPDTQATAWLNLKNIRFYLIENDTTKCFVDIPVIGYDEEWVGDSGLTKSDVTNIITTTITKDYIESKNIIATNISAATIAGKTLQSDKNVTLADSTTGPTWKIMNDGTGYLAKKNISWDADGNLEVKGKLLGTLGNGSDDVYLDGTLAIIDNDSKVKGQVLSALSGETTAYETYLDEDDVEHKRFITLATGFPEGIVDVSGDITLYRWVVKSDASSPKYTTLFTTYAYDDYKNGDVIELVYYFNGTKYVLADGEYRLYSGQIKKSKGTTAYGWVTDKYIYSVDLKTKYTYANTITVNNTQFNILQSAKTKIYSDGSIVTDNLHAEQGFFGGTIKAKGEFSGRLKECSGSIVDSRITNATINDSVINIKNYNTFTASRNNKEGNNETIFAITPKKNLDKTKTPVTYWWNKYSTYKQNRSKKDVLFKSTAKGESIFKFEVNKGDTVVIPAMYVSATVYQPRKKDITNKTKPMVGLFVKTPDGYKNIANGVLLTRDDKSAKYNKHQYTYGLTTASQTFTVSKGGTCEILFGYDVTLANKQCLDYAACTFSVDVKKGTKNSERCITVTPKDNDRNVMKIGANGIQIITTFGHKLTTTDGYIKMISANGKYGLQVDDNGIKVLRANEGWKNL